jgi:hypothetical protein
MDLDGLIESRTAPPNRRGKHDGEFEQKFYEGAVMLAFAMHLLRTAGTNSVSIYLDGMHRRAFDFVDTCPAGNARDGAFRDKAVFAGAFLALGVARIALTNTLVEIDNLPPGGPTQYTRMVL